MDGQAGVDAFLQFRYVGDDADQAAAAAQGRQGLQGIIQGFTVKGAEAFVDEHRIQVDAAGIRLDDVGQAQGQGEGGQEGFAAGQGVGRPGIARVVVVDFDVQADLFDPLVVPRPGALQAVTLTAHALQAAVGGGQDFVEEGAEDVAFKIDARLLAGDEFVDGADGFISFGQVPAFLLQGGQGRFALLPADRKSVV